MPFIQVFNVHPSTGAGRRNDWRSELASTISKVVCCHRAIKPENTEVFLPHDPSTPRNSPVMVFVDFFPEDDGLRPDERTQVLMTLCSHLEGVIWDLRCELNLDSTISRVRVRAIGRGIGGLVCHYVTPVLTRRELLFALLADERFMNRRLVTKLSTMDFSENDIDAIRRVLSMDGLRLGMSEVDVAQWATAEA